MAPRIELVRTNGIFSLDGQDFEVENNIWLLGDDDEVLVIDAAHDAAPIVDGGRRPQRARRSSCTHGHNDHINAAGRVARRGRRARAAAPGRPHAVGRRVPGRRARQRARRRRRAARSRARGCACCTRPGTAPAACACCRRTATCSAATRCSRAARARPAARTPTSATIIASIRDRLLTLPAETVVHTGHGDSTTIGDEAPHLDEWLARGH